MTWHESQEQGNTEIVKIFSGMYPGKVTLSERDQHGYRSVDGDPIVMAQIEGAVRMIDLMSPGGSHATRELDALNQLQRLIHDNLGCIEPALQPYEDK